MLDSSQAEYSQIKFNRRWSSISQRIIFHGLELCLNRNEFNPYATVFSPDNESAIAKWYERFCLCHITRKDFTTVGEHYFE